MGQFSSVQKSVIVPYNMLIWLKKSTVLTATHSLRSSPVEQKEVIGYDEGMTEAKINTISEYEKVTFK